MKEPKLQPQPWLACIEAIRFGDAESDARFRALVASFEPDHGIRAVLEQDIARNLEQHFPEHVPTYAAVRAQVPQVAPFSFHPMSAHCVLFFRAATLGFPGCELVETAHRWISLAMPLAAQNVLLSMSLRAASGSLADFMELTMREQPFQNYGQRSLHRRSGRSYELIVSGDYPLWTECMVPPFFGFLFEHFAVEGTVEVERLTSRSCSVHVRWR